MILNRWGGRVAWKFWIFLKGRIHFKNKYLNKCYCKVQVKFDFKFFELNILIHLEVFGDVFTAGLFFLVFILFIFAVIHIHGHTAVEMLFTKTNFRLHCIAHAKMRGLRHPDGGEEHKKGKGYGNNSFH